MVVSASATVILTIPYYGNPRKAIAEAAGTSSPYCTPEQYVYPGDCEYAAARCSSHNMQGRCSQVVIRRLSNMLRVRCVCPRHGTALFYSGCQVLNLHIANISGKSDKYVSADQPDGKGKQLPTAT